MRSMCALIVSREKAEQCVIFREEKRTRERSLYDNYFAYIGNYSTILKLSVLHCFFSVSRERKTSQRVVVFTTII